mgnify:CR=1 FL=1
MKWVKKQRKKPEKRNILIVLAALVLLVGGFFLPEWVFGIQNRKIQTNVETYTMENGSFHVANQLIQKANVMGQEYLIMDLYNGMEPEHSETEIQEIGIEAVQVFTPWILNQKGGVGPLRGELSDWSADAQLLVLSKENLSFVVWQVYMEAEGVSYNMTIDDATGKVLNYHYYCSLDAYRPQEPLDIETAAAWIEKLPEVFQSYYEMEGIELTDQITDRELLYENGWDGETMGIGVYQMKDGADSAEIYCHFGENYGEITLGTD